MPKDRAPFIVLEGIDGSGTTTQAAMLHEHLVGRGLATWLTREPTDTPLGRFIRDTLAGQADSAGDGPFALSESALCLLFAADRIEHSRVIDETRRKQHVICDRYIMSSIAYQSREPDISAERVIEVNRGCAVPDLTFYLDVSVDECLHRLEGRSGSPTVYEKRRLLETIARNYRSVSSIYQRHFGLLIEIDGSRPPTEVHEEITTRIDQHLKL